VTGKQKKKGQPRLVFQDLTCLIFRNDLEITLGNETLGFKYADDCTIIAPVYHDIDHFTDLINQFVR